MAVHEPIRFMGAPASPYTRKMIAVMRYRRLPYALLTPPMAMAAGMPVPKVPLLPTFYLPGADGRIAAVTNSSPIIRRLEREHSGRSIIPPDPALCFLDMLLEDYGDEWLTKPMFHYRWSFPADIKRAGETLPLYRGLSQADAAVAERVKAFTDRQIGRLKFVGSNTTTAPVIEASYARVLALLDRHLQGQPFLFGTRPASSDFAVYGQLTQLVGFDPTPAALAFERTPRVCAWTALVEDLSGLEPGAKDWLDATSPPATLKALLAEVGRTYAPLMLANAAALKAGASEVSTTIDGVRWVQQPFPYQGKCLLWLREAYGALDTAARATVDAVLAGTGCEALVAA